MNEIEKPTLGEEKPFSICSISAFERKRLILEARERIIISTPRLTSVETDALIERSKISGLKILTIFADISSMTMLEAKIKNKDIKILLSSSVDIRTLGNRNIAVMIIDDKSWIYVPDEVEESKPNNCISLSSDETEILLNSLYILVNDPEIIEKIRKEEKEKIGIEIETFNEEIKNIDLKKYKKIIFEKIKDRLLFIEISIHGIRMVEKIIPIKFKRFKFKNEETEKRFMARFKIFRKDEANNQIKNCQEELNNINEEIRKVKETHLKTIGIYGSCIMTKDLEDFKKQIKSYQEEKLSELKKKLREDLVQLLEKSKTSLKEIISDFYSNKILVRKERQKELFTVTKSEEKTRFIDDAINDLKLPSVDDILKDIKISLITKGLTEDLCGEEDFIKGLEENFQFKREDLFE